LELSSKEEITKHLKDLLYRKYEAEGQHPQPVSSPADMGGVDLELFCHILEIEVVALEPLGTSMAKWPTFLQAFITEKTERLLLQKHCRYLPTICTKLSAFAIPADTEFKYLENLTSLLLPENHIKSFPEGLTSLPYLKTLDLRSNELTSLPESIGSTFLDLLIYMSQGKCNHLLSSIYLTIS
jgi:Leucine-rich repeat (LRR) protein